MKMNDLLDISSSNSLEKYPMLKLAKDIDDKYPVKKITPAYHWLLSKDGKLALDAYQVTFTNNVILSIVFGSGTYSSNRNFDMLSEPNNQFVFLEKALNAEIAIIENNSFVHIDDWNDSVLGYQKPDEIIQVIEKYVYGKTDLP